MPSARHAVLRRSRSPIRLGKRGDRAGDGKRTELDEIVGISRVVYNWSHSIRTVVPFTASAEVILEIVVELERLAALQRHRAVEAPAVLQLLPVAARLGEVIRKDPREAVRHIEVRWPVFEFRPRAVVRLCRIRLKVLSIARIVERLGPHVIHDGCNSMPTVYPQAGLQRVVI